MRLTRLYLNGFKSFGEPTHIIFEPGVTVIVGPNGSGKSNIVDAIKWLMGERSIKNLRGSISEDLIFAGSNKRKRSNFAEVLMLLEDDNEIDVPGQGRFRSVEVKRVYHRGERGIFFINNMRAPEKEVEAFFGTSAKITRSFAIIEQGEVERIPSMKPEGLARMIQDAAQVGVFLNNKAATIADLEDAKRELEKLEPYIEEYRERRVRLAEEVERVIKYRELSNEKKKLEIALLLSEYIDLKDLVDGKEKGFRNIEMELNVLREEREDIQGTVEEIGEELDTFTVEYETRNRELQKVLNQIFEVKGQISKIEVEWKKLKEDVNDAEKKIRYFEKEIDEKRRKVTENTGKINALEQQIADLEKDVSLIKKKKEKLSEELNTLRSESEKINEDYIQVKTVISRIDAELTSLKEKRERFIKEKEKISEKIVLLTKSIDDLKLTYKEKSALLEERKAKIAELNELLSQLKKKERELLSKFNKVENELGEIKFNLREKELEIEKIEDEISTYADLGEGVANFIKWANEKGWKVWPLAERLVLKEENKGYLQLVSELANVVVVENFKYSDLIEWAKQDGIRVTLLLEGLDDFSPEALIGKFRKYNSVEEIVSGKENGYLADGIIRKGNLIVVGGDERGAARPFLLRKRLAKLKMEKLSLDDLFDKLVNSKKIVQDEIRDISRRREAVEDELLEFQNSLEKLSFEIEGSKKELYEKEIELKSLEAEKDELFDIEQSVEKEIKEKNMNMKRLNESLVEIENKKGEISQTVEKVESDLKEIGETYESMSMNLWERKREIENLIKERRSFEDEIKNLENKINRIKQDLSEKRGKLSNFQVKRDNMEKILEEKLKIEGKLRKEISVFEDNIRSINEKLRKLRSRLTKVEKKIRNFEIKRDEAKSQLEETKGNLRGILARLSSLTEKGLGDIIDDPDFKLRIPRDEAMNKIATLSEEIESLGEINHKAPVEYEEIDARIKELEEKRNDVVVAINKHIKGIELIERRAKESFFSILREIESNFNKLYGYLTGGGSAKFVYDKKVSLEEMKVDIQLSLPGKSVNSIFALSGGEKALTSIALILSFFMVNPAPFCVLDEVDAPLDVANTERFNNLIRELSGTTQFILVTHNHKTMEVADRIYGISMEDGISRVVSLSLKEYVGR